MHKNCLKAGYKIQETGLKWMTQTLEMRVKKNRANGIRRELLYTAPLNEHLQEDGYRIPIPTGAKLWKCEKGSVRWYRVYGLLGSLNDADLEPYRIIPPTAEELHLPNPNKLTKYQYINHPPCNGFQS